MMARLTRLLTEASMSTTGNVNNVGGKIGGIGDGSWNHGDYTGNVNNVGGKIGGIGDGSVNSGDYTGNVKNVGGKIGGIGDGSWNHGDYMNIGTANNAGSMTENNDHWHGYWGKK